VAFLSRGRLRFFGPLAAALAAAPGGAAASTLHRLCEAWMREDRNLPVRAQPDALGGETRGSIR
jgi:hypothetical protein